MSRRGPSAPPTVLFLCVHNAGRSQMALGWFDALAGGRGAAFSAGSEPAEAVNPAAVAVMAEVGIDIAAARPARWTDAQLAAADVVVTMGCGDACPLCPERATKTGISRIRPDSTSRRCARYATTSANVARDLLDRLAATADDERGAE